MSSSSVPALPSEIQTLADLFAWRVAETPTTEAYREHDPATDRWVSTTWLEAAQRVARFTERLSELSLARGARIAILLPNGLDAVCMDQAALALACTPVPMHALDNPASIAYILSDSDATLLIVDSDTQWSAIASVGTALPSLALVLVRKRESASNVVAGTVPVQSLDEWLSQAASPQGRARSPSPDAEDLAALVYTSGTTGRPKGVMLTHGNVVSNVKATLQRVAPLSSDVFLSFLPLSHTFERTAGYYLPIAAG
jgi:long-chain acyl-CoA synthetase